MLFEWVLSNSRHKSAEKGPLEVSSVPLNHLEMLPRELEGITRLSSMRLEPGAGNIPEYRHQVGRDDGHFHR